MGKNILGLLLWLMVPAVVSCGGHQRELAQIERILETNPSQADSLIFSTSIRNRMICMLHTFYILTSCLLHACFMLASCLLCKV